MQTLLTIINKYFFSVGTSLFLHPGSPPKEPDLVGVECSPPPRPMSLSSQIAAPVLRPPPSGVDWGPSCAGTAGSVCSTATFVTGRRTV